jgi:hypothetical protein
MDKIIYNLIPKSLIGLMENGGIRKIFNNHIIDYENASEKLFKYEWFPNLNIDDNDIIKINNIGKSGKQIDKFFSEKIIDVIPVYKKEINDGVFNEILFCYNHKKYYAAICALFPLIDSSLSDKNINSIFIKGDYKKQGLKNRESLINELKKQEGKLIYKFTKIIINSIEDKLDIINLRHDILHGKNKNIDKIMFLKTLSFYFYILSVSEFINKIN